MKYRSSINTCIANHKKVIQGIFVKQRTYLWWKKHNNCEEK